MKIPMSNTRWRAWFYPLLGLFAFLGTVDADDEVDVVATEKVETDIPGNAFLGAVNADDEVGVVATEKVETDIPGNEGKSNESDVVATKAGEDNSCSSFATVDELGNVDIPCLRDTSNQTFSLRLVKQSTNEHGKLVWDKQTTDVVPVCDKHEVPGQCGLVGRTYMIVPAVIGDEVYEAILQVSEENKFVFQEMTLVGTLEIDRWFGSSIVSWVADTASSAINIADDVIDVIGDAVGDCVEAWLSDGGKNIEGLITTAIGTQFPMGCTGHKPGGSTLDFNKSTDRAQFAKDCAMANIPMGGCAQVTMDLARSCASSCTTTDYCEPYCSKEEIKKWTEVGTCGSKLWSNSGVTCALDAISLF